MPFPRLVSANAVAVDNADNLYVTEQDNHQYAKDNNPRVWKLAAGASTPTALPFPGLKEPEGVAVDAGGNVYVTDTYESRVWKLAAGANAPTALPFTDLENPRTVAVDTAGDVYVADMKLKQVLKLAAGASSPTVLPFPDLESPDGVAVDADGNVYVTDFHDRCTEPSGPCAYLQQTGLVGDGRVLKLAAGASDPTVLPLSGLSRSWDVAVDAGGNVYVVDSTEQVVKLPVQS
jgi:serine/threonine-protein kinase